jgi:gluconokinase
MIILVMGTTGAGKTTVGEMLASRIGWIFLDADDFHPPANIEKMKHGIALTDADRIPWLEKIHAKLLSISSEGTSAVLACSALKQSYRDQLSPESIYGSFICVEPTIRCASTSKRATATSRAHSGRQFARPGRQKRDSPRRFALSRNRQRRDRAVAPAAASAQTVISH